MLRPAVAALVVAILAVPTAAHAEGWFGFSRTLAGQPTVGHPQNAAVDAAGQVYVTDTKDDMVRRFAADGASQTILAGAAVGTPLTDPFGLVLQPGGVVDVTDFNGHAIKRFDAHGVLLSQFDNSIGLAPTGIARRADGGLIVADAGPRPQLLQFSGGPELSLDSQHWTVLAQDLPGKPADILLMPNDRLVVTFPELGAVAMYDAVTGAQLNTFDKLELPEGLTMLDGDLLVAEGGSDRILDFPYLAKTTEQRFPGPHVLALVSGSSVAGVGCLFDTSALTVPRPPSFGLCNGASGGVAATAGTLDLFQSAPTPRPAPPAPRVVLDAAAANLVSGGQFRCSPVTPLGALSTIRCARFRQPDMHGVGGGALAALLLAAGRALGAAIIAGSQDNDFNFGGPVLVNVPRFRRSVGTASAAAVHRRVTVHLTPGKAAKVTFSLSPPARRALKRALRRHRVVHRTLVITVRDKTHGTSYKINRRLTFKRPRTG